MFTAVMHRYHHTAGEFIGNFPGHFCINCIKTADRDHSRIQRADLYERVAAIAGGKKPEDEEPEGEESEGKDLERRCVNSVPAGAAELGQRALGFPPLDGTGGTAEEAEAAINAILSEERKRETF